MTLRRKIELKWRGLLNILGAFALLGLLWASVNKRSDATIDAIVVTVDDYKEKSLLSPGDVKNIIIENFDNTLLDRSISRLDLELIEAIMIEDEMVNKAQVYVDNKNHLHVEVWTKKPLFRAFTSPSESVYVDDEGILFTGSTRHSVRVPIVSGHLPWITEDETEDKEELMTLMRFIDQDPMLLALVEQVHIAPDGRYDLAPKIGSAIVQFGQPVDQIEKLEKLKYFYKHTIRRVGINSLATINLDYYGQVVCTRIKDKT